MTKAKYTSEGLPIITKESIERYEIEHHVEGTFREKRPQVDVGELLRR